jgi:hypothetical protein
MELWLLAGEGAASDAQLEQLNRAITDDPAARDVIVRISRHQGWLAWNAASVKLPAAMTALAPAAPVRANQNRRRGRLATWRAALGELLAPRPFGWKPALGLCLAGALGFAAAAWIVPGGPQSGPSFAAAPIQATMVSGTGCIWGPGNVPPQQNGQFAGGDSLQLLEGIAELHIGHAHGDVALQMEGPASVVLTASGAPNMNFGKINLAVDSAASRAYPVDAAFGRVLARPGAEIGVVAFGGKA